MSTKIVVSQKNSHFWSQKIKYNKKPYWIWRKKWQRTPVFLPGKSHGRRNLVGYSPWGQKKKKEKKNTLNNYLQLQVIGNTHNLPDRRKVLLLTGKQWVKNGTAQCTKEANWHVGEKQRYNPKKGGIREYSLP